MYANVCANRHPAFIAIVIALREGAAVATEYATDGPHGSVDIRNERAGALAERVGRAIAVAGSELDLVAIENINAGRAAHLDLGAIVDPAIGEVVAIAGRLDDGVFGVRPIARKVALEQLERVLYVVFSGR